MGWLMIKWNNVYFFLVCIVNVVDIVYIDINGIWGVK